MSISLLAVSVVCSLSLWFSISAAAPALIEAGEMTASEAAFMSSWVSVGFGLGTALTMLLGLADLPNPRLLFAFAALAGAFCNALLLAVEPGGAVSMVLRFATGLCLAWIYPIGLRIAVTWAKGDTGLLAAVFTSSICIGSGLPFLITAVGGLSWSSAVLSTSGLAALSAALMMTIRLGPNYGSSRRVKLVNPIRVLHTQGVFLANVGYWGHKWENYAMWTWIGTFLHMSFLQLGPGYGVVPKPELIVFFIFVAAVPGNLLAGFLADRIGRTRVASVALISSGSCALFSWFFFGQNPWIVIAFVIFWGFVLIADSAQFSAMIIELSEINLVGTMLATQICIGYLITFASIHLVERFAELVGWQYAMTGLALGPLVGIVATLMLRRNPASFRIAGGKR